MKLSFDDARSLWLHTGHCLHPENHYVTVKPLNCGVKLTECGVCGHRINLTYN